MNLMYFSANMKEFFYKEFVPAETPEQQPGDAETKAVD